MRFRKIISIFICIISVVVCNCICTNVISSANSGEVLNSDIVAYINHYPIVSYNVDGTTVIVAEDLQNYGFNVIWNDTLRELSISKNLNVKYINPPKVYKNESIPGTKAYNIFQSDIKVIAPEIKTFTSYSINGKIMIPIEELECFGEVFWVPEIRAIKLWINWIPIIDYAPLERDPNIVAAENRAKKDKTRELHKNGFINHGLIPVYPEDIEVSVSSGYNWNIIVDDVCCDTNGKEMLVILTGYIPSVRERNNPRKKCVYYDSFQNFLQKKSDEFFFVSSNGDFTAYLIVPLATRKIIIEPSYK